MDQIRLGPLNLPVSLLFTVVSMLLGSLTVFILYRAKKQILSRFFDIISSAFIIALVFWKLFPLIYNIKLIASPLALLYTPGGLPGIITGAAAGLLYFILKTYKTDRSGFKHLLLVLLVFAASSIISGAILKTVYNRLRPEERIQTAYMFSAENTKGIKVSMEDFRGKTVILNFWATWCPPCRGELPTLTAFSKNLPENTVILGINATSSEKSKGEVLSFIKREGINFPVLFDNKGTIAAEYGVKTLPTTLVISPEGTVTAKKSGAADLFWLRSQLPR